MRGARSADPELEGAAAAASTTSAWSKDRSRSVAKANDVNSALNAGDAETMGCPQPTKLKSIIVIESPAIENGYPSVASMRATMARNASGCSTAKCTRVQRPK
eukprot:Amastigsp_a508486_77.p5 type:complete len:103 gc:universal Amastigsp_a508486_77:730-422(-)